jgi:hypothetical protein
MKMDTTTFVILALTGIAAGFLGGLVGVGGGIIMVPVMVFFLGMSQHSAQGTSLAVLMVPVSAVAVYNYWKTDHVNFRYALIIALFFIVGGYLGSRLSLRIDQNIVKKVFAVFMLVVAIKMLFSK